MTEGPQGWGAPLHARVLDATGVAPGVRVLDLGCGWGTFARAAAERGAQVTGLDRDPAAVAAAAAAVPAGSFLVGDAHDPPRGPFDAVVAVQLLEHVANPLAVLRAAGRVGGVVAVTVWGREQECDVRAFGEALAPWLPPRRAADRVAPGPPPITEPARLRKLVELAGLRVELVDEVLCPFDYPDEDALLGPLLAAGIGRAAAHRAGRRAVRDAVLARLAGRTAPPPAATACATCSASSSPAPPDPRAADRPHPRPRTSSQPAPIAADPDDVPGWQVRCAAGGSGGVQRRRLARTGITLRAASTSPGSMSTTSRPGSEPSWSTSSPIGPTTALAPIPVGARPGSRPTVAGSAWSQAATKVVESSARARTSRSHCARLPGPAPQDAGTTTSAGATVAEQLEQAGEAQVVAGGQADGQAVHDRSVTGSVPGATVSDSANPNASNRWILS